MNKRTDWEAWDKDFGPRDLDEAIRLKAVAEGAAASGPYTGQADDHGGWIIRRSGGRMLLLTGPGPRKGFSKFLWYYTSGKRPWRVGDPILPGF